LIRWQERLISQICREAFPIFLAVLRVRAKQSNNPLSRRVWGKVIAKKEILYVAML
jgi:hypothetical protein